MNRRTATLAAVGVTAWACIMASQIAAVAAPADHGNGPDHGRIERLSGDSIGVR